jgi:DNA transposition AAA+ family ATPase
MSEQKKEEREQQPTTYPCNESLRAALRELRDGPNSEWSNGRIASEVGYTAGVISQYLNERGNQWRKVSELETKIAAFLRDINLKLDTGIETIACDIASQINDAVEEIRTAKRAGAIIGAPGIGKSRGIDLYLVEHPQAIAFRVCAWERGQSDFAECLYTAADVGQHKRGLSGMKSLVEKLTGSNRPLLVDDAHKATRAALQLAYDFRDATGVPLVFLGDHRLIPKLKDDPQRLRRTGRVFTLKLKEPLPLIRHHIAALCPGVNGEEKELVAICKTVAENAGHFGSLQMELSLAARIKQGKPDWGWCECVRRAHKKLIREYELTAN